MASSLRCVDDSTLLREVGDGGAGAGARETMTLLEHTLLSMYHCAERDFERVRTGILEQVDEGYLEVADRNETPGSFAEAVEACEEWDAYFRGCGMLVYRSGLQTLVRADCIEWLRAAPKASISAVVTDPPYGLLEYTPEQVEKLRSGQGGVWRHAPAFDGAARAPLPRFTVLSASDRARIYQYFVTWGRALLPVMMPGAHVFVAGNPLVAPLISCAMEEAGFERRGEIVRLVRTFRGGDRPKGAEAEFPMASTMPRACYEPWGLYRRPLGVATVAENLRRWGVGALRRRSAETPFLDVIESTTTPAAERAIAPHPSVKPQALLRQLVDAALPCGSGTVRDTFAGGGTTLGACEALRVGGIGIEIDPTFFALSGRAIPLLARVVTDDSPRVGGQDSEQLEMGW